MTTTGAGRLAWGVCLVALAFVVAAFALQPLNTLSGVFLIGLLVSAPFCIVGALVASRRPHNPIGWLFLGFGTVAAFLFFSEQYSYFTIVTHPGDYPFKSLAVVGLNLWHPAFSLFVFSFLLFPHGRLLSPRWRPVAWCTAIIYGIGLISGQFVRGAEADEAGLAFVDVVKPEPIASIATAVFDVFLPLQLGFVAIAAISLVLRLRRSTGEERQQIKWFAFSVAVVALSFPVSLMLIGNGALGAMLLPLVPISAGIAILKYRLYDIDVVISRAIVFGVLAAFITAVYVAIVVGAASVLGAERDSLALSILATALVALAFQPLRARVERFANRIVYGERATPYDVLARFARSLAAVTSLDEVLPGIARHTAEGLRAELALVTLYGDDEPIEARHPDGIATTRDFDADVPVAYKGETIGRIAVVKPPSDPLTGQDHKLLSELSSHAGVVLHNLRLALELSRRLVELRAQAGELKRSRERLVTAADSSRRSIERAIRQRVERRLAAIARDLDAAKRTVGADPPSAAALLDGAAVRTNETLEELRDLARGIYPPLLADKGIVTALEAHIRKAGLDAALAVGDGLAEQRFPRAVETACYFCVREALDNVVQHAGKVRTTVTIERRDDSLAFSVRDEGTGFELAERMTTAGLQSMSDRIAAAGGELVIESASGAGTTVAGWVPLSREDREAAPVVSDLAAV